MATENSKLTNNTMRKYLYVFLMLLSAIMYFVTLIADIDNESKLFFGSGYFFCFISAAVLLRYADK